MTWGSANRYDRDEDFTVPVKRLAHLFHGFSVTTLVEGAEYEIKLTSKIDLSPPAGRLQKNLDFNVCYF